MVGYVRKSVADIINGLRITAPPLNAEFNAIELAFDGSQGHSHTGVDGDGPKLSLADAFTGYLSAVNGGNGGKNNWTASGAPNNLNDTTEGYAPGSFWFNAESMRLYICVSDESGAAIWQEVPKIDQTGRLAPGVTDTVDLGTDSVRFRDAYLSGGLTAAGALAITGQVTASGGFSGDLTGNVEGALTGNVTAASGTSVFQDVTVNGVVDLTTGLIRNLGTPVLDGDAATKAYVDQVVSQTIDAAPGALDTLNELAAALGDNPDFAATITAEVGTKLPKAGGTMTGDLAMGGNTVTGLRTPAASSEAVTLGYLNTRIEPLPEAEASADLAERWAEEDEDIQIEPGQYSAKHHAIKAKASETSAETDAQTATDKAAKAQLWANEAEDVEVETGLYSGRHYTLKSQANASAAQTSANNAATSESNASDSEDAAAQSETNAATSETNAAVSEINAAASESNATGSASAAATSASNASGYETGAEAARDASLGYRDETLGYRNEGETFRDEAQTSAASIEYARALSAGTANIILNPQGAVNQEGAGFVGSNGWAADQWRFFTNGTVTGLVSTFPATNHIKSALRLKSEAVHAAGSMNANIRQSVELARLVPLRYGGENAKPSGLSFWVWCTVPGLYSLSIRNSPSVRTFLAGFTVDAPNKWEFKTVAVPPETDAGWGVPANLTDLGAYLTFHAAVMPGSTGAEGWQNGNYLGLPGQAEWGTAADQSFYVSQIVWAPGAEMMTEAASHAAMRPYADELRDCQRYYWKGLASDGQGSGYRYAPASGSVLMAGPSTTFHVPMRVPPSMSASGTNYINCTHDSYFQSVDGFTQRLTATAAGVYRAWGGTYTADARL